MQLACYFLRTPPCVHAAICRHNAEMLLGSKWIGTWVVSLLPHCWLLFVSLIIHKGCPAPSSVAGLAQARFSNESPWQSNNGVVVQVPGLSNSAASKSSQGPQMQQQQQNQAMHLMNSNQQQAQQQLHQPSQQHQSITASKQQRRSQHAEQPQSSQPVRTQNAKGQHQQKLDLQKHQHQQLEELHFADGSIDQSCSFSQCQSPFAAAAGTVVTAPAWPTAAVSAVTAPSASSPFSAASTDGHPLYRQDMGSHAPFYGAAASPHAAPSGQLPGSQAQSQSVPFGYDSLGQRAGVGAAAAGGDACSNSGSQGLPGRDGGGYGWGPELQQAGLGGVPMVPAVNQQWEHGPSAGGNGATGGGAGGGRGGRRGAAVDPQEEQRQQRLHKQQQYKVS